MENLAVGEGGRWQNRGMTLKLNANHQVVWLDPNTMQLGLSQNKVVLSGITAGQEKLIDALYFGVAPNQLDALAKQYRMPLAEAQKLVQQVSGLLEREFEPAGTAFKAPGNRMAGPINFDSARADSIWSGLQHSSDGGRVLQARSRVAIFIDTLDATGLLLAGALAAAGVGVIVSGDDRPVTQQDIGANAYPQGLLGHPRAAAARMMLEAAVTSCRVVDAKKLKSQQLGSVTLAIIVAQQVMQPARYQRWVSAGVPHLAVTYSPDFVEVSPVVTATGGCLYCQQLWLQEQDATWSVVSSQLHSSQLRFDPGWLRLLACGFTVQSALNSIDVGLGLVGGAVKDAGGEREIAGVRFTPKTRELSPLSWERHPACSCGLVGLQQLQKA